MALGQIAWLPSGTEGRSQKDEVKHGHPFALKVAEWHNGVQSTMWAVLQLGRPCSFTVLPCYWVTLRVLCETCSLPSLMFIRNKEFPLLLLLGRKTFLSSFLLNEVGRRI